MYLYAVIVLNVLHKELPFIRLLVPLGCGILTGYLTELPVVPVIVLFILSLITLPVSLIGRASPSNRLFGAAIFLLFSTGGFLLLHNDINQAQKLKSIDALYICRVKLFPEKKARSYALTADIIAKKAANEEYTEIKGGIVIYLSVDDTIPPKIIPGDILAANVQPLEITNRGNPFEFDYSRFMLKKGIKYYAFSNEESLTLLKHNGKRTLREKALIAGRKVSDFYHSSGIEARYAGLLSALTLGQKDMIDEDTREAFAGAGVMHIMAVSGLHAGVVSMFVFAGLFFLKGKLLVVRVVLSVLALWGFAFITGLPPSVVRASIMFTFLHTGKLLKRPVNSINSILAAAFFMLIIKPSDLTMLSFQLSFSAVLFISAYYYKAKKLLHSTVLPLDKIWQIAVVSVLAQAGTLPFTLNAFGRFPVWFLPANILIIPVASLIIIISFIMIMTSPITPLLSVTVPIINTLLWIASSAAEVIAGLPGADNTGSLITWAESLTLLLAVWITTHTLLKTKERNLLLPLLALLPFIIINTGKHIYTAKSSEIVVYNTTDNSNMIGIRSGHNLYLLIKEDNSYDRPPYRDFIAPDEAKRHASVLKLNIVPLKYSEKPIKVNASGVNIVISPFLYPGIISDNKAGIVVVDKLTGELTDREVDFNGKMIVTSERKSNNDNNQMVRLNSDAKVHYIRDEGAWTNKRREKKR